RWRRRGAWRGRVPRVGAPGCRRGPGARGAVLRARGGGPDPFLLAYIKPLPPILLLCLQFQSDFESDFFYFFLLPCSSIPGHCFAKFLPSNLYLVSFES